MDEIEPKESDHRSLRVHDARVFQGEFAPLSAGMSFFGQVGHKGEVQFNQYNVDVPQYKDLDRQRHRLHVVLESLLKKMGKPPIVLVEHEGCFTNLAMRLSLQKVLGGPENAARFLRIVTLSPLQFDFPDVEEGLIYILGGSLNDTYDSFGDQFISRFLSPLFENLIYGIRGKVIGVCFGHQAGVQAAADVHGIPVRTRKHGIQYGFFPVIFQNKPPLEVLGSLTEKLVVFTRTGFPKRTDEKPFVDVRGIETLATNGGIFESQSKDDPFVPPGVLYKADNGQVIGISTIFHPEIQIDDKDHLNPLVEYIVGEIRRCIPEMTVHPKDHLIQKKLPKRNHLADAYFTSALLTFSEDLLKSY